MTPEARRNFGCAIIGFKYVMIYGGLNESG